MSEGEDTGLRTVLTGIKPTGSPHLGNYAGMLKPALAMMAAAPEGSLFLYFIADYHALTTLRDPEEFRTRTYEVAATWLALGLDPHRAVLYRQSDVPEVFELCWLLSCVTPKGQLNRAHAYKAAVAANRERSAEDDAGVNMGLYDYPLLMAADILLFQTDLVPVGEDQVQHVEIARDIAVSFNAAYGPVFKLPAHSFDPRSGTMPGLDGRKMSKSYGNVIPLFARPDEIRRLVFSIRTDSTPADAPKDASSSTVFAIYREFASDDEARATRQRLADGRMSWKEAKEELCRVLDAALSAPRRAYEALMADTARLDGIL
jgi:tryptophanyl-tRNA synthetase